jgi:hypothetical protein
MFSATIAFPGSIDQQLGEQLLSFASAAQPVQRASLHALSQMNHALANEQLLFGRERFEVAQQSFDNGSH